MFKWCYDFVLTGSTFLWSWCPEAVGFECGLYRRCDDWLSSSSSDVWHIQEAARNIEISFGKSSRLGGMSLIFDNHSHWVHAICSMKKESFFSFWPFNCFGVCSWDNRAQAQKQRLTLHLVSPFVCCSSFDILYCISVVGTVIKRDFDFDFFFCSFV